MFRRVLARSFWLAAALVIAACGQGNSGDTPASPPGGGTPSAPNSFLLFPNPQLQPDGTLQTDSVEYAQAYYRAIDPNNDKDPGRADCGDSVPNKQRATEVLEDVADVDQCASGVGYPYDERNFTVCVEDVA